MAAEPKRGCGYRKIGGLYLVAGKLSAPCDRLPWPLEVCPTCGGGIKFCRGWTWITPFKLFETHAPKSLCRCFQDRPMIKPVEDLDERTGIKDHYDYEYANCPMCSPLEFFGEDGQAGLLWIGEAHYKTPADFIREGAEMGVSRRVKAIPRGFKVGETWIFVAHIKACLNGNGNIFDEPGEPKFKPGIFSAFKPHRIERMVKQSEYDLYQAVMHDYKKDGIEREKYIEAMSNEFSPDQFEVLIRLMSDVDRGITLIPLPDDDPDHQP